MQVHFCLDDGLIIYTVSSSAGTVAVDRLSLTSFKMNSSMGGPSLQIGLQVLCSRVRSTLRAVHLQSSSTYLGQAYLVDFVRPLLECRQLKSVDIYLIHHFFLLPDQHLIELVTAWPQLVHLALAFDFSRHEVPNLKLICDITTLCPSLTSLWLSSMKVPLIEDYQLRGRSTSSLAELIVSFLLMPEPTRNLELVTKHTLEAYPGLMLVLQRDGALVRVKSQPVQSQCSPVDFAAVVGLMLVHA